MTERMGKSHSAAVVLWIAWFLLAAGALKKPTV
jgi:hypothetical protein